MTSWTFSKETQKVYKIEKVNTTALCESCLQKSTLLKGSLNKIKVGIFFYVSFKVDYKTISTETARRDNIKVFKILTNWS